MKKSLATTLGVICAVGAFAQGQINFSNKAVGTDALGNVDPANTAYAPIYGPETPDPTVVKHGNTANNAFDPGSQTYTGALLKGTGYTVTLWGANSASNPTADTLQLVTTASPVRFRTSTGAANDGFWQNPPSPLVMGVPSGAFATFEVRVWDNKGGTITTWAQVLADPSIAQGTSGLFAPTHALNVPPDVPFNLSGLKSFNLHTVPEPSVIALGVVGLGALLLRRRKA